MEIGDGIQISTLNSPISNLKSALRQQCAFCEALAEHGAVGVKEGQGLQVDDVAAVDGVALGQDGHAAADLAAGLLDQGLQGLQAFAGGDDIVDDPLRFLSSNASVIPYWASQ